MLMFTQGTGWDAMRADVGHTLATMRAAGEHEGLQAPLAGLLARWTVIEGERAAAADRVTEGNAAVAWGAAALGRAVGRFAVQLLAACDNDRSSLTFQAYFPERPSEVQGLALEAMVARVGRWADVRKKCPVEGAALAALADVDGLVARGADALALRERATAALASVSLDMKAWREEANDARRHAEVALDRHAAAQARPRLQRRLLPAGEARRRSPPRPPRSPPSPRRP
ncbi:MAG: hypothetical protein U0324_06175 [Polyangiales bacterium]